MDINTILVTRDAKLNFLKGLIRLSRCDNDIDEQEVAYFSQAAASLGLDEDDIQILKDCWITDEKIPVTFENNTEKMFFFIEAVQLCWMDDVYLDIEKQTLREIADELNISHAAIEAVEDWVYEGMQWYQKGDKLLELK